MSLFDEEITTESLEDLGFVQIGRNKWLYLFTALFTLTGQGDLKFAYDELIYYPKKKYLITKNGRQKYPVDDLQELKLIVTSISKTTMDVEKLNDVRKISDF